MSLGDLAGNAAEGWHPRSFVLTDVVGSVGLWESDPDAMAAAVARHDALVVQEVTAAGGTVVRFKGAGDSTFSVFESPLDAVTAAAAIPPRRPGRALWPQVEEICDLSEASRFASRLGLGHDSVR